MSSGGDIDIRRVISGAVEIVSTRTRLLISACARQLSNDVRFSMVMTLEL
jgi:hypothetical protein